MKDSRAKSKSAAKNDKTKKLQAQQGREAPNKPKRPPKPFFIYLKEFEETFKEQHPNVENVSEVERACTEKWKAMSAQEKASYQEKAAKKRVAYEKALTAFNKKMRAKKTRKTFKAAQMEKTIMMKDKRLIKKTGNNFFPEESIR